MQSSSLGNRREHIVQGSRHPQGWSERNQVFIITCEVEVGFIVSNWISTCATNSYFKILFKCGVPLPVVGPLRMVRCCTVRSWFGAACLAAR